jgi:hypothetical protein
MPQYCTIHTTFACQAKGGNRTLRCCHYVNSFPPALSEAFRATAAFNIATLAVSRKIRPSSMAEKGGQVTCQAVVI